jgi:hypothetical protein
MGPFMSGKARFFARRPSPIHSIISSSVASIFTGSQPMLSISWIRFRFSTIRSI